MKKTLSVQVDAEKLRAIQFYASKKSSTLNEELEKYIQVLYEKYVPQQTREYIESVAEHPAAKPKLNNPDAIGKVGK